ncbi:hypothetical protein APHAL10511_008067 [Amanita phalloides]|nr:hypothetical protein APHAL10511_008067 [Amanita phalloides]
MANQQLTHLVRSPLVLPTEIVLLIMDLFATTLSTGKLRSFPWFLGHICSAWRSIFLSMTAEFWSRISIEFVPWRNLNEELERTKNVVHFFLERDSAAPFSFEVKSLYRLHELLLPEGVCVRQTLDMLMDTSMRWKDASFTVARAKVLLPLLRAKHRLPILIDCGLNKVPDLLFDVFQNAPHLNDVVVRGLGDWKFNFEDLEAISLDELEFGAPHFITALPRMTKLKRLRIGTEFDDKLLSSIIVLPNLTILSCEPSSLHFLEAPTLEDLTIEYNTCNPFNPNVDNIQSFLSRSSSTMNILSLGIIRAESATAIDIIKLMPQLAHLKLVNLHYVNNRDILRCRNVLEALTISTNAPLACQMLSLSISDFAKSRNNDDQLISLVLSRTTRDSVVDRLQKLDISDPLHNVSRNARNILIALCKKHGVQFVGFK